MFIVQFLDKEMFAKVLYNLIKIAQVVMNIHHGAPGSHKNG